MCSTFFLEVHSFYSYTCIMNCFLLKNCCNIPKEISTPIFHSYRSYWRGSSNTLYLLQEFKKSCFNKSVTSFNYLNYVLPVISLFWGKYLNKPSCMSRNGPQFNFVSNACQSRTCSGIQLLKLSS